MMKRRIISILLAVCLMLGALSGCSAGGGEGTPTTAENGGTKPGKTTGKAAETGDGPMGRYVEQQLEFPQNGGQVVDILSDGQGGLELYMNVNGEGVRYTLQDGNWREEASFLQGIPLVYGLHVILGEDGNRYVIYPQPEDYRFRLFKVSREGEPQELLSELLSEKNQGGMYRYYPDFLAVTGEGNILISNRSSTEVFTPEGTLLFAMPQEGSSVEWKTSAYLNSDEYMTIGQRGFLKYDVSRGNGTPVEEIPYQQEGNDQYAAAVVSDGKGGFYAANSRGIHHMVQGGSIWETVVDGSLNSLSQPSVSIFKLFAGSGDDFYVWMTALGGEKQNMLKHYVYDPEMPTVPSQTLTVYGLDLSEAETIRQAAAMFQLSHPQVRVELIDGADGGGNTTVSDTIRALNTELLTGGGADVLVLDGLPAASYIEKGVLADMSGSLADMMGSGELAENVAGSFKGKDGEIYQIPARMILLAAYGDAGALQSLGSLEQMREYQSEPSHLPLRPRTNYENLLRQVLTLRYNEIVDGEQGKPVPGKIRELLETVRVLGEACGAQAVFEASADGGMGDVYNRSFGIHGLASVDYWNLDLNETSLAVESVNGMTCLMLPFAVIEKHGLTLEGVEHSWIPRELLGVNRAGENRELAMEFVRFALGTQVQDSDLGDGLPVNSKSADNWIHKDWENSELVSGSSSDGHHISGSFPDEQKRACVMALAAEAAQPIMLDRVLTDIIVEETRGYFEGTMSLDQAAQNVENKANLYFSE